VPKNVAAHWEDVLSSTEGAWDAAFTAALAPPESKRLGQFAP